MKKVVSLVFLATLAAPASAAPVGPVTIHPRRFTIGTEFGGAFNRDYERTTNNADIWELDERLTGLGRAAYGLTENWEVFGRFGGGNLELLDEVDPASVSIRTRYDFDAAFAWGAGLRGRLWPEVLPRWDLMIEGGYFAQERHDGTITGGAGAGSRLEGWRYYEWNVNLLFQHDYADSGFFRRWAPYIGPTFGDANIKPRSIGGVAQTFGIETEDHVGLVVGTGARIFELGPAWEGYLEGRFIDETALNAGLRYTFGIRAEGDTGTVSDSPAGR